MNTININEIIIPEEFINSCTNENKIQAAMEYYEKHNELDKPVVIKDIKSKELVNNYVRYLVAKQKGLSEIPYLTEEEYEKIYHDINKECDYICGVFKNNQKEYVWKNPKGIDFEVGDKALVKSEKSKAVVTVTKVFKTDNPTYLKHKKVFKKLKRKEYSNESGN